MNYSHLIPISLFISYFHSFLFLFTFVSFLFFSSFMFLFKFPFPICLHFLIHFLGFYFHSFYYSHSHSTFTFQSNLPLCQSLQFLFCFSQIFENHIFSRFIAVFDISSLYLPFLHLNPFILIFILNLYFR